MFFHRFVVKIVVSLLKIFCLLFSVPFSFIRHVSIFIFNILYFYLPHDSYVKKKE